MKSSLWFAVVSYGHGMVTRHVCAVVGVSAQGHQFECQNSATVGVAIMPDANVCRAVASAATWWCSGERRQRLQRGKAGGRTHIWNGLACSIRSEKGGGGAAAASAVGCVDAIAAG